MTKAFISHVLADEEEARRFAAELEARNIHVLRLERLVTPGFSWTTQLQEAISESDIFFVLVSPESEASQWVTTETAVALSQLEQRRSRIVPVILDRGARPSVLLQNIQGIEWYDSERASRQLDELVRSIESERLHPHNPSYKQDLKIQLSQLFAERAAFRKESELSSQLTKEKLIGFAFASEIYKGFLLFLLALVINLFSDRIFRLNVISRWWWLPFILGAVCSFAFTLIFSSLRFRFFEQSIRKGMD
jgi:hypothetical protein